MADLETIKPIAGHADDYLFLKDAATGQAFKAKHVLRTTAGDQPALTISLSPVGEDGKALLNVAGNPDITTLTHTFTEVELADPAFDEEARVSQMIAQLAIDKQNEIAARGRVLDIGKKWARGSLDLAKRVPEIVTVETAGEPS